MFVIVLMNVIHVVVVDVFVAVVVVAAFHLLFSVLSIVMLLDSVGTRFCFPVVSLFLK